MAHPEQPQFTYHHLGLYEGRVAGTVPITQDMPLWEIHPGGDEFLYLLSGSMACILEEAHGESSNCVREKPASCPRESGIACWSVPQAICCF